MYGANNFFKRFNTVVKFRKSVLMSSILVGVCATLLSCNKEKLTKYEGVPEIIDTVEVVEPSFVYDMDNYTADNNDADLWKVSGTAWSIGHYPVEDSASPPASYLMCEYYGVVGCSDKNGCGVGVSHTYNRINNGDNGCYTSPISGYAKRYFDPKEFSGNVSKIELSIDSLLYIQGGAGYSEIRIRWNQWKITLNKFKKTGWRNKHPLYLQVEIAENREINWSVNQIESENLAECEVKHQSEAEYSIELYSYFDKQKKAASNHSRLMTEGITLQIWE